MNNSVVEIMNLLYRYAELIDSGNLAGAAELFHRARLKIPDSTMLIDADGVLEIWKRYIQLYPCGTPRTRHIITNPIIDIDEAAGTAKIRSCYTVYQATEDFPLQLICAGRYHDKFERVEGVWRFSYRDYSLLDIIGDMSAHMKQPLIYIADKPITDACILHN